MWSFLAGKDKEKPGSMQQVSSILSPTHGAQVQYNQENRPHMLAGCRGGSLQGRNAGEAITCDSQQLKIHSAVQLQRTASGTLI
jgi:hypothetical protein